MAEKRIKKRFFSSVKEKQWLDSLGEKGYLLISRKENSYSFELTERQWHYSVEWLDCAADSEDGEAYIAAYEQGGIHLAAVYSLWAYFVSETPFSVSAESECRTAKHYRNTAIILAVIDAIAAVLIGYQVAIRSYLQANQVLLEAPSMEKADNVIVNLCRRLLYGGEVLLYRYSKFCSKWFGDTKATTVLGILIPLAVILTVLCAFWVVEWLKHRPDGKKEKEQEETHVCEESETSGKTESDC